ncbi:MAG: CsiV family protein [Congregibacter sp.]
MRRPDAIILASRRWIQILTLLVLALGMLTRVGAQAPTDGIAENWYKTELLVFVRDPNTNSAEQWDPQPQLNYPQDYRFLIDAALLERRWEERQALGSELAENGVQYLQVPTPIEELLSYNRPDALITPPEMVSTEDTLTGQPAPEPNAPPEPNAVLESTLLENEFPELLPDPNEPLLALPYQLVDTQELAFSSQAGSLRRQGHTIVFHGAWWAQLDEAADTAPVILDRSGDVDTPDWPALQGSVHVYRSRYLHLDVNLWLNTEGGYLPQGWSITPPPLAQPSVLAHTLAGAPVDLWAAQAPDSPKSATYDPIDPSESMDGVFDPSSDIPTATEEPLRIYPWRHAITHRQSRRMRSGEIHYLDHPAIGVIVRITPVGEEDSPLISDKLSARAFRARHNVQTAEPEALDEATR